jgi:hypothetical protein
MIRFSYILFPTENLSARWRNQINSIPMIFVLFILFYFPLKYFSLIWRRHRYRWRAAKFRPMLDAQGIWAERDLYRATPAVTRDLGFSGLIWRTAPFSRLLRHTRGVEIYFNPDPHGFPFSRLLRHTRGCGGPILTRILTCHLIWFQARLLKPLKNWLVCM